jgi:hypothetical protein
MKVMQALLGALACAACSGSATPNAATPSGGGASKPPVEGTFADDVAFLRKYTNVVVLGNSASGGPAVAVAPEYQGRVMTSTAAGDGGASFGFINREVVASKQKQPHITVFGGEDRFWLGPEGGQFGLYFPPGAPYDFDHWQVPEAIDWGGWDIAARDDSEVRFAKDIAVKNHLGTEFRMHVERTVRLLTPSRIAEHLGAAVPQGVVAVGYESENSITNTGTAPWTRETGLPSVWILGMFRPSPTTTVVIPFMPGSEGKLGKIVNDAYFGKIPSDRLRIKDSVLFFSGDGKQRGKIGIPAPRAVPVAGSYDTASRTLTIVQYTQPEQGVYVNSMWEQQEDPYGGDVVNSYNDGPPAPGKKPLGPFYELETSSPGAELAPGKTLTHVHRTVHLQGDATSLDPLSRKQLGVGIGEIGR